MVAFAGSSKMALDFSTLFAAGPSTQSALAGYQYPSYGLQSDEFYKQLSASMNQAISNGVPQSQVEQWGAIGSDNYAFANGGTSQNGSGITGSSGSSVGGLLGTVIGGINMGLGNGNVSASQAVKQQQAINSNTNAAVDFLNVGILSPRLITIVLGVIFVAGGLWMFNSEAVANAIQDVGSKFRGSSNAT